MESRLSLRLVKHSTPSIHEKESEDLPGAPNIGQKERVLRRTTRERRQPEWHKKYRRIPKKFIYM